MSQDQTKKALKNFISGSTKFKCASLTGDWGTGKSHLVDEYLEKSSIIHTKISLFGISSIEELRKTVVTNSILKGVNLWKVLEGIKGTVKGLFRVDIGPLTTPSTELIVKIFEKTECQLFIIDDLERSDGICINELLGFVESLKLQTDLKILLILNHEKLDEDKKDKWQKFREKIIDKEIFLRVEAEESVDIVKSQVSSRGREIFSLCAQHLDITNIRVLEKIKNDFEYFTSVIDEDVESIIYEAQVKSVFLFSAIHWDAFEETITLDELVDFKSRHWGAFDPGNKLGEEYKQKASRW